MDRVAVCELCVPSEVHDLKKNQTPNLNVRSRDAVRNKTLIQTCANFAHVCSRHALILRMSEPDMRNVTLAQYCQPGTKLPPKGYVCA